jgi:hypothetical protein
MPVVFQFYNNRFECLAGVINIDDAARRMNRFTASGVPNGGGQNADAVDPCGRFHVRNAWGGVLTGR